MRLTGPRRDALRGLLYVKPSGQEVLTAVGSAVVICHGTTAKALLDEGLVEVHQRVYVRRGRKQMYREYRLTREGRILRKELREGLC